MADFMAVFMHEAAKELLLKMGTSTKVWTLFPDGASNVKGSEVGIVLKLPTAA